MAPTNRFSAFPKKERSYIARALRKAARDPLIGPTDAKRYHDLAEEVWSTFAWSHETREIAMSNNVDEAPRRPDPLDVQDLRVDIGAVLMALRFIPEAQWTGFHRLTHNTLTEADEKLAAFLPEGWEG